MTYIKVLIDRHKCCYCGACVSVCPVKEGALELEEVVLILKNDICIECGNCAKICPVGALTLYKSIQKGR